MKVIEGRCTHCDKVMIFAHYVEGSWQWVDSDTMLPGCPDDSEVMMVSLEYEEGDL